MNWKKRLMGAALATLFGLGSTGFAQDSPAAQKKYFSRKLTFRIPIRIDEQERDTIKELKLFSRAPNGEWACTQHANVTQTAFPFHAEKDGEYWFSIVTVDKSGKATPADPTKDEPALIVVVDTQLPEIDVRPLAAGSGQSYLQCRMIDANPDYASMKMEFQAVDGSWKPLEFVPSSLGVVRVPIPEILDGRIRVHAADRAGNVVDREIDLNLAKVPGPPPVIRDATPAVNSANSGIKLASDVTTPKSNDATRIASLPGAPPVTAINPIVSSPPEQVAVVPMEIPTPVDQMGLGQTAAEKMHMPTGPAVVIPPASSEPDLRSQTPVKLPAIGADTQRMEVAGVPLVNSAKCSIDFAVESTPKGIAQVEVWTTADECQTWKLTGVSVDGKSPVQVEFPGDGRFGYMFRVMPQRGSCPEQPKAGDSPDGWLEVDTTKPLAELLSANLDDQKGTGELVISWSAKDANLGLHPVSIYCAPQLTGPWLPIAERIANTGNFRWSVPRGIGAEVFLRVEVSDRAGNVTRCETPAPIQVVAPRPKVRVLHVAPAKP